MTRITLDADLKARLMNLTESLELCDERGTVVARVSPVPDPAEWESVEPPVTEAELDVQDKTGQWYTTAELFAHLERL